MFPFISHSGTNSRLENLAHRPTAIMGYRSNKKLSFAQWNYRIMCHKLKNDLPASYFKVAYDAALQQLSKRDDVHMNSLD